MRKIHWTKKSVIAAVSIGAVVVASGGVAFAFWTAAGSGTGSGATGTTAALTVVQSSVNTGLYPGGTTALAGTITNPNPSPVTVTAVTATVTAFTSRTDATKPACTQADFTITGTSTVASPVPANSSSGGAWSGLSLSMTNSVTNQDNCKTVTVPITYASN